MSHGAEIVNGDDVRMIQACQRLGFAREPLGELRILLLFPRQDFERDETVQARLSCLVHHAHAAAAETFKDFQ